MTGVSSFSRSRFTDIIFVPSFATHGSIPSSLPRACSWMPYIFGMDGPVISASRIPAVYPFSIIILAREAVTMDLPTPPLPLITPMTFLTAEYGFAGFLKSFIWLVHVDAWEHPAQPSEGHPSCFFSSAIFVAPIPLLPQSLRSRRVRSLEAPSLPRSFSPV